MSRRFKSVVDPTQAVVKWYIRDFIATSDLSAKELSFKMCRDSTYLGKCVQASRILGFSALRRIAKVIDIPEHVMENAIADLKVRAAMISAARKSKSSAWRNTVAQYRMGNKPIINKLWEK